MIILKHNLAENRETGTCNRYVASDLVMKSLTEGIAVATYNTITARDSAYLQLVLN